MKKYKDKYEANQLSAFERKMYETMNKVIEEQSEAIRGYLDVQLELTDKLLFIENGYNKEYGEGQFAKDLAVIRLKDKESNDDSTTTT